MSSTQRVRLYKADGRFTLHVIEVIDYDVTGWKRVQCLPHGEVLGLMPDKGDVQTAIDAARRCKRHRQLPFAPLREPLQPTVTAIGRSEKIDFNHDKKEEIR